MDDRWERITVKDNSGRPLEVWRFEDEFELAQEVNLGREGGWVFQLTRRGRRVDLFANLELGMAAAVELGRPALGREVEEFNLGGES